MNIRIILNILGRTVLCEAALLLFPLIVSLIYGESILGFSIAIGIALLLGAACMLVKPRSKTFYAREGLVVCALSWITLSLIGAVPFTAEKWIPNYIDALFEIVSGFTTTGATLLEDFTLSGCRGLFFWRSLSHFIGGMGVIVFILAIMPLTNEHSIHLMRAEVPGPIVGKLVPRMKNTAKILYGIYIGLTFIEFIFLLCGKMSVYDAAIHAMSTAGTGGFSVKAESIAAYSPYIQYVISVFMLIFAVNFNLYYFILIKQWRTAAKNEELHWFAGIVICFTAAIALNSRSLFPTAEETFRTSLFQVSSIISSTGFATIDLVKLPVFSQALLVILMFIGACAGSTGGGLKVSRIIILLKSFANEIKRLLRSREVVKVRLDGKPLSDGIVRSVSVIFGMYMFITAISVIMVSLDGFTMTKTATAVISCMGNMGPGLWPGSSFADFSWHSKLVLSLDMLIGRLEITPVLMLFIPGAWSFKRKTI